MNIIFLDIDGVLNSRSSIERFNSTRRLCPDACRNLKDLVEQTDSKIVISSTWRLSFTLDQIIEAINQAHSWENWSNVIIDKTPHLRSGIRQEEIDTFLDHIGCHCNFVVLDDDNGDIFTPLFVHVDRLIGLTENDVIFAKELFNVQ